VLQALSMGVHESQSLLWERMVALSLPFSSYLAPKLTAAFPQLVNLQVSPLHFHVVILSGPFDRQ
jgi:carboxypeptidase Taq